MTVTTPMAVDRTSPGPVAPASSCSSADRLARRLLRISSEVPRLREAELRSAFSRSIVVSAVRCLLTYLVIPFGVAPLLGLGDGIAPLVGVPLGLLAIVFNVKSIRRFWRADHRWRWAYTAVGTTVIVMLVVLVTSDLLALTT